MERADPPVAAWRGAVGEYVTEPAGDGPTRIEEADGSFRLTAPGTWPAELELLPLTGTLAIALYSAEGGTLVHLERDGEGHVVGFRRPRNDGQDVRGVRRGSR